MSTNNIRLFPNKQIINAISSSQEQDIYQAVGPNEYFYLKKEAINDNSTNADFSSFNPGCNWVDGVNLTVAWNVESTPFVIINTELQAGYAVGDEDTTASGINQSNSGFLPFFNSLACDRFEMTVGNTPLIEDQADRQVLSQVYKYMHYDSEVVKSRGQYPLPDILNRDQWRYTQPSGTIVTDAIPVLPIYFNTIENFDSLWINLNNPSRIEYPTYAEYPIIDPNSPYIITGTGQTDQAQASPLLVVDKKLPVKKDNNGFYYPVFPEGTTYAAVNKQGKAVGDDCSGTPYDSGTAGLAISGVKISIQKIKITEPFMSRYLTDEFKKDIEPMPYYMSGSSIQFNFQFDPKRLSTLFATSFIGGEACKFTVTKDTSTKSTLILKCYNTGALTGDRNTIIKNTIYKSVLWTPPTKQPINANAIVAFEVQKSYTTTPQFLIFAVDAQTWDGTNPFYNSNTAGAQGLINPISLADIDDVELTYNQTDLLKRFPDKKERMRFLAEMTHKTFQNVNKKTLLGDTVLKVFKNANDISSIRHKLPFVCIDLGLLDIKDEPFFGLTKYTMPMNITLKVYAKPSIALNQTTLYTAIPSYQLTVYDIKPTCLTQDTDAGVISEVDFVATLEEMTAKRLEISKHEHHSQSMHMYGGGWFDNVKKAYEFISKNAHYIPKAVKTVLSGARTFADLNRDNKELSGAVANIDAISGLAQSHLGYGKSKVKQIKTR